LTEGKICIKICIQEVDLKSYSSREVIKLIEADGWVVVRINGSHHHFKHPVKKGIVTVKHPDADIPPKTLSSIARQAGVDFK